MKTIIEIVNKILSIFGFAQQTQRDNQLREDGANEAEIERRNEQDKIKGKADDHRKKNNSSTDDDVLNRL